VAPRAPLAERVRLPGLVAREPPPAVAPGGGGSDGAVHGCSSWQSGESWPSVAGQDRESFV